MQATTYSVFDPTACGFPSPRVPLLPTLTVGTLGVDRRGEFVALCEGRPRRHYVRGRYALHDAYRLAGLGPQGALLAPAYHCRTMLDPASRLGAPIVLYGVDRTLEVDVARVAELAAASEVPVRALLLSHYFGFAQRAAELIRSFCEERRITLIEDCSHAMLVRRGHPQPGDWGRYVIASPYKMFPCDVGGLLVAAHGEALPSVRPPGWLEECRTLWHIVRGAGPVPDLPPARSVAALNTDIERIAAGGIEPGKETHAKISGTSRMYDPAEEGIACPRVARAIARWCDVGHIAERRRANYRRWSDAVRGLPHCRPLHDELSADCVPYMFPLVIDEPQPHFYVLKKLGVPIWRWDEMADSPCAVSRHYREHLLHLPCHQSLTDDHLEWMTAAVAAVMRRSPR